MIRDNDAYHCHPVFGTNPSREWELSCMFLHHRCQDPAWPIPPVERSLHCAAGGVLLIRPLPVLDSSSSKTRGTVGKYIISSKTYFLCCVGYSMPCTKTAGFVVVLLGALVFKEAPTASTDSHTLSNCAVVVLCLWSWNYPLHLHSVANTVPWQQIHDYVLKYRLVK